MDKSANFLIKNSYARPNLSVESLGKATLESHYNYYNENKSYQNGHESKSLQQLYNVDKIVAICESKEFKNEFENLTNSTDKRFSSLLELINTQKSIDDNNQIYNILQRLNSEISSNIYEPVNQVVLLAEKKEIYNQYLPEKLN